MGVDAVTLQPAVATRPRGCSVDVEAVTHRYGAMTAVDSVSLSIAAGEVVALLGPSGCGKTTLLRIIAGFVRQSAGAVHVDGRRIDELPSNLRNIGIVFQNYALFPHMSVAENVAYGLRARGRARAAIAAAVERMGGVVQLAALRDRLPRQLSGGQQQRVALARALAVEPSVLLLDEPFSALDKGLRLDMQIELKRLQRQFGLTAILVTHDQDEAMSVADRIAVMNSGRVEQFDAPASVYDRPASLFVSGFVGTSNRLRGRVRAIEGGHVVVDLDAGARLRAPCASPLTAGARIALVVRPEQLMLSATEQPGFWPVTVRLVVPLGPDVIRDLETRDGARLKLAERRTGANDFTSGAAWCGLRAEAAPSVFAIASDQEGPP